MTTMLQATVAPEMGVGLAGFHVLPQDSMTPLAQGEALTEPRPLRADDDWETIVWEILKRSGATSKLFEAMLEPIDSSAVWAADTSSSGVFSPKIVEFMEVIGGRNPELQDALHDLDEVAVEAGEEKFQVPSETALANARRLLRAMYRISSQRFEVYPTPDGEVAIDAPGGYGRSVLLLCDSDGGALCLVNMIGSHRRAHYSDAGLLPDSFVRDALIELSLLGDLVA